MVRMWVACWVVAIGLSAAAQDQGGGPGKEPMPVDALGEAAEAAEELPAPTAEVPAAAERVAASEPAVDDGALEAAEPPAGTTVTAEQGRDAPRRVLLEMDVAGELFASAGTESTIRRPIAVEARFDFVEEVVSGSAASRDYAEASAVIRIDGESADTALAADARRVTVALRGTTPVPYLAEAFLSRDEADLLDVPFDSLLVDRIAATGTVAAAAKWTIPADIAAGMLAIDTIESGGLDAELAGVDDGLATVRFAGIIDGAVDGSPTHLVVEGDCTAAATAVEGGWRLEAPRTLAVTIRERRQAGHVAPGLDVEARIRMSRRPAAAERITVAADGGERRRGAGRPGLVWSRDRAGRFDLVHDGRWKVVEDGAHGLVMRLVDRGALVAQCSLTALPRGDARAAPSIAEVQRDIERSLAGQFGRFTQAAEATRSDGVRIVRVVSEGMAGTVAFRWIHHVLTDAEGRRAAATFMLEAAAAERFAEADRDMIDGFAFPAAAPASGDATPPDREARAPRGTVQP